MDNWKHLNKQTNRQNTLLYSPVMRRKLCKIGNIYLHLSKSFTESLKYKPSLIALDEWPGKLKLLRAVVSLPPPPPLPRIGIIRKLDGSVQISQNPKNSKGCTHIVKLNYYTVDILSLILSEIPDFKKTMCGLISNISIWSFLFGLNYLERRAIPKKSPELSMIKWQSDLWLEDSDQCSVTKFNHSVPCELRR